METSGDMARDGTVAWFKLGLCYQGAFYMYMYLVIEFY